MGHANGRVSGVDALTARARGAKDIHADILSGNLHIDFIGLRKHRHGRCGGVDAALRFSYGYALDPMNATFKFKTRVDATTLHLEDDFLEAADACL